MAAVALRSEERIGLVVAVVAHVGLAALLLWHPRSAPVVVPPERIEVTFSDDVGLTSTSPEPQAEAAPDLAPDIGEPPPPEPEPPVPVAKPEPPQPRAITSPRPVPKPTMRPEPPKPVARPTMRPAPRPSAAPSARPVTRPGGSRIGTDFLQGVQGARGTGTARNPPAAAIGPAVQSALSGAITRQLKPRWAAPQGAEAEKLVTILSWSLNRDGSLAGSPRVVRQEGITDANRPQAARHAEQAMRAVELAAPFQLPNEYYDAWKRVASFRFDKRLSQ